jgi:ATP-dependent protease HslVU (ClpYQ) peptidase subunit
LPKDVEELAISAVRHVLSSFNNNKVEKASVCMNDGNSSFEITVCVSVYYRIQGIAEFKVILRFANGWHVAEKVIHMPDGELKDYADRLMREVVDVAKYAYNIYEAAQLLKPGQVNA